MALFEREREREREREKERERGRKKTVRVQHVPHNKPTTRQRKTNINLKRCEIRTLLRKDCALRSSSFENGTC